MNFFNIGTAELLLIFAIALIVVGPRRLPQIARDFGKILNDLRKMSQEFTADLTLELDAPSEGSETAEIADQKASEKAATEVSADLTPELDAPSEESETAEIADQKGSEKAVQEVSTDLMPELDASSEESEGSMTNDHLTKDQGPSDQ
jgi:Tat protein translocase TatB subunit